MEVICTNLQKKYDQKIVLNIPQLEIKSGEVFGFIGQNGAGKSTLMRLIAGLEVPDSGEIRIDGRLPDFQSRQQMTMVFQKPYMINGSVLKNICYPLRLRNISLEKAQLSAMDLLEQLDIGVLAHQQARTLSGGEVQKVALARALVFKPKLMILDEPTANIDPQSVRKMEKLIWKANKLGTTVLLVTHQVAQAARLCTRIGFMKDGNLIEQGIKEDILSKPRMKETRDFLSDVSLLDFE